MTTEVAKSSQFYIQGLETYELRKAHSLKLREFYYKPEEAERWVKWFERFLTHTQGETVGEPLLLARWQKRVIRKLFGWRRVKDDTRRYKTVFWYIPRKNGKTLLMAGIALGLIAIDGQKRASVYVAAATEKQAGELFGMARDMIKQNEDLSEMFEIVESTNTIVHKESESFLQVLTSTPKGKAGSNPYAGIIDEYQDQPNVKLRNVIRTGMVARKEHLMIYILTAGDDKFKPWFYELQKAKKIRKKIIRNESYLPLIFEADLDRFEWDSMEAAQQANPGFGISVLEENLQELIEDARLSEADKKAYLQYNLNVTTQREARYIKEKDWSKCFEDYTEDDLAGLPCFGGMDLAKVSDLCALGLIFPFYRWEERLRPDGKGMEVVTLVRYKTLGWTWLPEDAIEHGEMEGYPYLDWKAKKFVEVTRGNCTDYGVIRNRIVELGKKFKIQQLGYDPYLATEIVQNLQDDDGFKMVEVRQGSLTMSPAVYRFEHLVLSQEIRHNNHEIMNWHVYNAVVIEEKKNLRSVSKEANEEKIDLLTSQLIALKLAMVAPKPKRSIYEDRGLLSA
jgi:phage terminase large subunit-like protein